MLGCSDYQTNLNFAFNCATHFVITNHSWHFLNRSKRSRRQKCCEERYYDTLNPARSRLGRLCASRTLSALGVLLHRRGHLPPSPTSIAMAVGGQNFLNLMFCYSLYLDFIFLISLSFYLLDCFVSRVNKMRFLFPMWLFCRVFPVASFLLPFLLCLSCRISCHLSYHVCSNDCPLLSAL